MRAARAVVVALVGATLACRSMATSAAEPREVRFASSDGGVVAAHEYGRGAHAVVLAPGGRYTRWSWAPQAHAMADAGLRVLAVDLRTRGDTRGGSAGEDSLQLDVLAAVRWLRAQGATRVSLVGASIGGWAVAEAALAARPGEVDRVALLAHSPIDWPDRLPARTLFVVASGDTTARGEPRLVAIRAQWERAPEPKKLVVVDGTKHAQALFGTSEGARVLREIIEFLVAP